MVVLVYAKAVQVLVKADAVVVLVVLVLVLVVLVVLVLALVVLVVLEDVKVVLVVLVLVKMDAEDAVANVKERDALVIAQAAVVLYLL